MTHKGVKGALSAATAEHFPKQTMLLKQPNQVELHTVFPSGATLLSKQPPPLPEKTQQPNGGNNMLFTTESPASLRDNTDPWNFV